jgi:acylphosphatase
MYILIDRNVKTMKLKYYILRGKVQGVFCRANIKAWAEEHKVLGWVRNLRTGEVQLMAWAPENIHSELKIFLKEGPGLAQVESVEELDLELSETYTDFAIRPDGDYETVE